MELTQQAEHGDDGQNRLVTVGTSAQDGTSARLIRIEASFGRGFSGLQMIGHTGQIVEDGKERARMALERLGGELPARKLLISVSPGDVKVDGNHLDLAFAVAMAVIIHKDCPPVDPSRWVFAAEIGIGGELRPVPAVVCHGVAAMTGNMEGVVVANENLRELKALEAASAKTGKKLTYRSFRNLNEVLAWLWSGTQNIQSPACTLADETMLPASHVSCFDDMELTREMELVAMAAAAGMHSVLLRGVPGCGKSMFAQRLPSLLPELSPEEHLAVLEIHSCHPERVAPQILRGLPPYRAPHHFASTAALLGAHDRPGEVALASGGVLFLDEFPEFRRDVIEALREPLESGEVQVSRAHSKRTWRAKMMLVAAANNCPCGWRGSAKRRCICPENRLTAYRNRLSGPILDRIDMHVNMPERTDGATFIFSDSLRTNKDRTSVMKTQIAAARSRALRRNRKFNIQLNRDIPSQHLSAALGIPAQDVDGLMKKWIPGHISTRSIVRCFRVARTLADLDDKESVSEPHIEQAWSWQSTESARNRGDLIDLS